MSEIQRAAEEIQQTLSSKNQDYRIDGEFSNFQLVADATGVSVEQVMLTQVFIKLGRLKGLADSPNNEARLDTYKDLAGYATILYAYASRSVESEEHEYDKMCRKVAYPSANDPFEDVYRYSAQEASRNV